MATEKKVTVQAAALGGLYSIMQTMEVRGGAGRCAIARACVGPPDCAAGGVRPAAAAGAPCCTPGS